MLEERQASHLADKSKIGEGDDAFYICTNGKYPFAITIPGDFTPVTERVNIGEEYTEFDTWVATSGTSCAQWYKAR